MKFLHLSDTHIRRQYQTNLLTKQLFTEEWNPTQRLREFLKNLLLNEETYEFALITGDLVHEGQVEDYELFRTIWQETYPSLPYFFCRGNHDREATFFEGMGVFSDEFGNYLSCSLYKGVRMISLDSAQENHHEGRISATQMAQLRDWLSSPSEKGTILLLHHPLVWEEEGIETEVPEGFEEIIQSSDIIGIFVGHIHQGTTAFYAGKPQYMSEAFSFGVNEYETVSVFTDRTGYNSCSITKSGLLVAHHYLTPKQTEVGKLNKPFEGNF